MIPELGHFCLALAVVLACAQGVLGIAGPTLKDPRTLAAAPILAVLQFISVALAFLSLVWASVVSDFTVEVVANFSSASVPLLYRIAGVWGDHAGSILLWCLILSGCGMAIALAGKTLPASLHARVLGVLGLISCGFLLFTLVVSPPFTRIWPAPLHGAGINPILQDPALAVHPPILYCGYVGFSVAFAFAVAALIEGRVDAAWGRWVRPWVLLSWCFLTAGIALGSWWSYNTLGWGGFWFWDPVENAALLPWLTGTALLHCAIVVEKRESLKSWAVLLAIATFSLSLSGTFLVRSGVLNSVHSFAVAPDQGLFLLVLLGLTIGGSLLLFAIRAPRLIGLGVYAPLSRESALIVNNILLCALAAVVLIGTLYPPFVNLLFGTQLSVGAPFFNQTVLPMTAPLLLLMGIGPLLSWKRARLGTALQPLALAAAIALLVFILLFATKGLIAALGISGGTWVVAAALTDLAVYCGAARHTPGLFISRLITLPRARLGALLGHLGFGIMVIGVAAMTLSVHTSVLLRPHQSVQFGGYKVTLLSLRDVNGPDYTARVADVTLSRAGHVLAHLAPAQHLFANGEATNKAAIHRSLLQNIYIVYANAPQGAAELSLNWHPGAPELWLGALVMILGGLVSLSDRQYRLGMPRRHKRPRDEAVTP